MSGPSTTRPIDPRRIAIIGFGEVGPIFARGLIASGRHDVATYDILLDDRAPGAGDAREGARRSSRGGALGRGRGRRSRNHHLRRDGRLGARRRNRGRKLSAARTDLPRHQLGGAGDQAGERACRRARGRVLRRGGGHGPGSALWNQSADPAGRQDRAGTRRHPDAGRDQYRDRSRRNRPGPRPSRCAGAS